MAAAAATMTPKAAPILLAAPVEIGADGVVVYAPVPDGAEAVPTGTDTTEVVG